MVLRSCQHIDVLWSWTNLPGLRLVILLLVLRTSESGGHWALGNGWESISIELQSPAVSIRALAGLWWVICPERDLFDQWPHLIMCPLCPFIKLTTALRLIFILNLGGFIQVASKNRNYFLCCNFSSMLNLRFENEMNVQMNIFVGTSTTTKFLFAWT